MSRKVFEYVKEVHEIVYRDRHSIHPEGVLYWTHWSSALEPEEAKSFDRFYSNNPDSDNILGDPDQLISFDDILAVEKYNKLVKKIQKGKKYDSYTGALLTKARAEQYLQIMLHAMKYYH